jgi:protein gp37
MSLREFHNYDMPGRKPVLAWNPLAMRCDRVSEGCRRCWHLKVADRLARNPALDEGNRAAYAGLNAPQWTNDATATLPAGRVICVQFMGDLWHPNVHADMRAAVLSMCGAAPSVFLLLTKRPERVAERIPPNCGLGASAHSAGSLREALAALAETGAARQWVSLEPLLGEAWRGLCYARGGIDFVAAGPETGGGARPCDGTWIADVAHFCRSFAIPFYDKRPPSKPGFTRREWPELFHKYTDREVPHDA